jgi:glycosyltransferase involved in cell wall biosynthesis
MAGAVTVMVLTSRLIESRYSGYDVRVANLCAYTPGSLHLVVAPLLPIDHGDPTMTTAGLFDSVTVLPPLATSRPRARRHLRLSDTNFLRLAHPRQFAATVHALGEIVRDSDIDRIVVFGGDLAEYVEALGHPNVVIDICDSVSLTTERELDHSCGRPAAWRRWSAAPRLHRVRAAERHLTRGPHTVVTISAQDTRALEHLAGRARRIDTVPNGVDPDFLEPLGVASRTRGVVFWGNLSFAPNQEALRFFLDQIYPTCLRPRGVEFCIVGPNAPPWLVDAVAEQDGVTLTGHVADLRAVVTRYPIMINPMTIGSGLKNKVLEAFGLGIVVVSTSRGIEAIPLVRDGVHLMTGDDARSFGAAVLALLDDDEHRLALRSAARTLVVDGYRWDAVGALWRGLFPADADVGHGRDLS